MFSKFLNQDKEKQDRIINAAIKEFAHKGYDLASTNEIVKEAGISKGLLFHYFGNKKQLYLFLYDYCVNLIADEIYKKINLKEADFFLRIRQTAMAKMEILSIYPDLFRFMEIAYMENSNDVKEELDHKKKEFTEINIGKIYENIDASKFREDMALPMILKIVTWTFEKMGEEAIYKAKLSPTHEIEYDQVFKEATEYIEILKKCFYKGDSQ